MSGDLLLFQRGSPSHPRTLLPPLPATLLLALSPFLISYLLTKCGLHPYNYADLGMAHESHGANHNMVGYFFVPAIPFAHFRKGIVERAVEKVARLRSVPDEVLGIK